MLRTSGSRARALCAAAMGIVLAVAATPAAAQARGAATPAAKAADDQVIALTEANWAKFLRATENIYALRNDDTTSIAAEDDEDERDHTTTAQTVASLAATIDRLPPLRQAITSAGMTTTEYAQVQVAILFAGLQMMADSLARMHPGATKPGPVADPVQQANVAFLNRHTKDLQRLQALEDARKAKAIEKAGEEEKPEEPEEPTEPE